MRPGKIELMTVCACTWQRIPRKQSTQLSITSA